MVAALVRVAKAFIVTPNAWRAEPAEALQSGQAKFFPAPNDECGCSIMIQTRAADDFFLESNVRICKPARRKRALSDRSPQKSAFNQFPRLRPLKQEFFTFKKSDFGFITGRYSRMSGLSGGQEPSRISVFIPTATKLTSVVSLIEEPFEVGRSTICINKTTTQARVADSYNDFVKQPTGVIHRLFAKSPYPVYRLDVSSDIEAGESWQLAVFAAHALHEAGDRLDLACEPTSSILWATGAVNSVDYSIGKVSHVSEKLQNSREFLEKAAQDGRHIYIFVPTDNIADIHPVTKAWLDQCSITLRPVKSVNDVLLSLDLPAVKLISQKTISRLSPTGVDLPNRSSPRKLSALNRYWAGGLLAAAIACAGVAKFATAPAAPSPPVDLRELTPVDCTEEKNLRSLGTMKPTGLTFVNLSGSAKRIYWIAFDGTRQLFDTLNDNASYAVKTYVTHPWVVTNDSDTCEGIFFADSSERKVVLRRR